MRVSSSRCPEKLFNRVVEQGRNGDEPDFEPIRRLDSRDLLVGAFSEAERDHVAPRLAVAPHRSLELIHVLATNSVLLFDLDRREVKERIAINAVVVDLPQRMLAVQDVDDPVLKLKVLKLAEVISVSGRPSIRKS